MPLHQTIAKIQAPDEKAMAAARKRWDSVAKPLKGLGLLEEAVARIAGMTGNPDVTLGKKGVVTSARVHERVLAEIAAFAPNAGWQLRALDFSPIAGGSGNLEFLGDFFPIERCEALPPDEKAVRALVDRAHRMIK